MTEEDNNESIDDVCEECKKEDESVSQNLILTGYKLCNSCRTSKTIFPIQLILDIGRALILLITNEIDKKAIIKKDKNKSHSKIEIDATTIDNCSLYSSNSSINEVN